MSPGPCSSVLCRAALAGTLWRAIRSTAVAGLLSPGLCGWAIRWTAVAGPLLPGLCGWAIRWAFVAERSGWNRRGRTSDRCRVEAGDQTRPAEGFSAPMPAMSASRVVRMPWSGFSALTTVPSPM